MLLTHFRCVGLQLCNFYFVWNLYVLLSNIISSHHGVGSIILGIRVYEYYVTQCRLLIFFIYLSAIYLTITCEIYMFLFSISSHHGTALALCNPLTLNIFRCLSTETSCYTFVLRVWFGNIYSSRLNLGNSKYFFFLMDNVIALESYYFLCYQHCVSA